MAGGEIPVELLPVAARLVARITDLLYLIEFMEQLFIHWGISMSSNIITTQRKIGKITYLVTASPSEKATDTIEKKIEKLIIKDMRHNAGKQAASSNLAL
jgi:hypothetical protein